MERRVVRTMVSLLVALEMEAEEVGAVGAVEAGAVEPPPPSAAAAEKQHQPNTRPPLHFIKLKQQAPVVLVLRIQIQI